MQRRRQLYLQLKYNSADNHDITSSVVCNEMIKVTAEQWMHQSLNQQSLYPVPGERPTIDKIREHMENFHQAKLDHQINFLISIQKIERHQSGRQHDENDGALCHRSGETCQRAHLSTARGATTRRSTALSDATAVSINPINQSINQASR